ncbi:hypothetical protein [Clostridium sp.]|uniref:hypothetical protein n=1 Tax=Clostridium sp. TaxID=1506 RepID=UPI00289D6F50|nr:hypothetical protein [Clostridium sp.]
MQGRIKVLKDVDKSNILPMTHAKAVYVDEENTLDKTLDDIESQIIQQRKTYAELKELKENNQLVEGKKYLLRYRTRYQQPTTLVIKEMEVEELILTASSKNTFEPIVFSTKYPSDVVWYDFDDNLCEDKLTPRYGFILRRYDPISKNDAPQDWRTMLWARYKPALNYYREGVLMAYRIWDSGTPSMSHVYKADNKLWMAKNTNTPTSPTDTNVFYEVYPDLDTPLLINEKTKIAKDIELMRGVLVEVPTFGTGCVANTIVAFDAPLLHNNVFIDRCYSNSLGSRCYNNTFNSSSYSNTFIGRGNDNIFTSGCSANSFLNWCSSNYFSASCGNNSFGNYCNNNTFGTNCINNSFGNRCYSNHFGHSCQNNSFGNTCYKNIFGTSGNYNSFGNYCYENSFGNGALRNSIGNRFENNTIGSDFDGNNFGNTCYRNTFGNSCYGNNFSGTSSSNNFGSNCSYNLFMPDIRSTTFGSNFKHNLIKNISGKDLTALTGSHLSSNINCTIEQENTGKYIYWFIVAGTTTTSFETRVIP